MEQRQDIAAQLEESQPTGPRRDRQEKLRQFRGPVEARDAQLIERWRQASPTAHAAAMIELARYAEMMVAHTGYGKDAAELFPGFPPQRAIALDKETNA